MLMNTASKEQAIKNYYNYKQVLIPAKISAPPATKQQTENG